MNKNCDNQTKYTTKVIVVNLIFSLLLIVGFQSCKSNVVYHKSVKIPESTLSYTDTISFDFVIKDTSLFYNLVLDISYSEAEFGYENLYTNVITTFPNGLVVKDLLSFEFRTTDAIESTICRSEICKLPIFLQSGIAFENPGTYHIGFVQNSRDSILNGISEMDFEVRIQE